MVFGAPPSVEDSGQQFEVAVQRGFHEGQGVQDSRQGGHSGLRVRSSKRAPYLFPRLNCSAAISTRPLNRPGMCSDVRSPKQFYTLVSTYADQ